MRAVILGSDIMYDSNGNLIPIEINTALTMDGDYFESNPFDFTSLLDVMTAKGLTRIIYIGALYRLDQDFKVWCELNNFTYEFIEVKLGSITIPEIEDASDLLIVRTAYDSSAILDDSYCKNKVNFLNLISNQGFHSQFAYMGDNNEIINKITTIPNNGIHPNFILKSVLPQYNRNTYPKLYKVSNQAELDTILTNVDNYYFLMEYHINLDKLYENHIQVIRSFNMVFPSENTLTTISIGNYTRFSSYVIPTAPTYNTETFEVDYASRNGYLTDGNTFKTPKLLVDDYVEMWDGTFKIATDLVVGDVVKGLSIPYSGKTSDLDDPLMNYRIDYDEFVSGSTFVPNIITHIEKVERIANYGTMHFDDDTTWSDTSNSSYLIYRNNEVRFAYIGSGADTDIFIVPGDQVILVDTASETELVSILKTVSSVTEIVTFLDGYLIEVENRHVFLTSTDPSATVSFAAIEHNAETCCTNPSKCIKGIETCNPKNCLCELLPS